MERLNPVLMTALSGEPGNEIQSLIAAIVLNMLVMPALFLR
jgi:hypothetical protein